MKRPKASRVVLVILIILAVFLVIYSQISRRFIDPDNYLRVGWEYTGQDPHILNWQEPEMEVLFDSGGILVHFVYHTDQDREIGPYSIYIDPFQMKVVKEDPRVPTGN